MFDYYLACWQKYFDFRGRSRRREFWYFQLGGLVIALGFAASSAILAALQSGVGQVLLGLLYALFTIASIVPGFAVGIRRLHDTDRSGWWTLVALIPLLGALLLLFFDCEDGTAGPNRYGEDPKTRMASPEAVASPS